MTLFGLEVLIGLLIGGLTTTKTVTEIQKNLRGSSSRKQAESLAIIAQADQHKFDSALTSFQRQDDNRLAIQLSHNGVLREIERARAAGHRANLRVLETYDNNRVATHRAYARVLERFDNNRLAAHLSNNELLRALEESRRLSQTEFTQLFRDVIYTWQDDRIMFFNKIRTDQQTITIILVVVAVLMYFLGESRGELKRLQGFINLPHFGTVVSSNIPSSSAFSTSEPRVASFFNAVIWGAGLVLIIGPGWTIVSYIIRGIAAFAFSLNATRSYSELKGHTDRINSLVFSPDGSKVASGSNDRSVRIWQTVTGEQLQEHKQHIDSVDTVAFSSDGTQISSCSSYRAVIKWDAATGGLLQELQGGSERFTFAVLSPDGARVVTNRDIYLWVEMFDTSTGRCLNGYYDTSSPATTAVFSADGDQFASGAENGSIGTFRLGTRRRVQHLQGHTAKVCSVAYSPDKTKLASGAEDCSVRLWHAATARQLEQLNGHTGPVRSVCFSPDGTKIASASDDRSVIIWDVAARTPLRILTGHTAGVRCVVFSPDNSKIASGSDDRSIRIWDVATT